jgi:myo-inositol 2-dehydrogenase/D-chiro-inositol 1-dehydrogenase
LRAALIGAGRWAEVHRQALAELGVDLSGVLVASEGSRQRVEHEWDVPVTTELQEFLNWPCDAVMVVSPNYLHSAHGVAALEAGKHVLVEKPLATTLEDCDRLLGAAARSGKVLAVGLEMRVFSLFAAIKAVLDRGEIGRPLHLKLDLWRRPYRAGAGGWKSDPSKLGSSVLEEPIHYLDLARWYLGEPTALQAWASSRPGREELWENLDVRLEFEGGASALVTRSIAAFEHHVGLELVAEDGALRASWDGRMDVDPEPAAALTLHSERGTEIIEVPQHTGHAFDVPKQTAAFIEAIAGRGQPAASGEDGRAAVALCLAVGESLRAGSRCIALRG